jgi:hypothetical protein
MTELRTIDDGLWVAEDDNFVGGGAWFPVRMTVVRVGDGLWVHSPIPLGDALVAAINTLGAVKWVVNPNGFHGKWAAQAMKRWPDAAFYCSSAHALLGTKLPAWSPLEGPLPTEWGDVFEVLLIDGCPKVAETVFLHRGSKTLITTDLIFNIHTAKTWLMPWVLRLVGAWQRPAQSRLWRLFTKDRSAAGASLTRMLAWDFERVILAHGDILEDDARGALGGGLHWMLGNKALPAP